VSVRLGRVQRVLDDLRTLVTMPRVEVVASRGGAVEDELWRDFNRPHPRFKVVARKAVGAELLPLDELASAEEYLERLRYARRRVRRASRLGYTVALFDPSERRADLLAIHASLPERQGRPIDAEYLDPAANSPTGPDYAYVGVLRDGTIVAYSRVRYAGDIAGMDRVMGHGDHLAAGVMFLLVAGIVEHVKEVRPQMRYIYYDMFFGAGEGLREFKTRAGFTPHYVRWKREVGA
jgi:hypothetical protein